MDEEYLRLLAAMSDVGLTMEDATSGQWDAQNPVLRQMGLLTTMGKTPPIESPMHNKVKSLKPGDVADGFNYAKAFFNELFELSGEWHWEGIQAENPHTKMDKVIHVDWDIVTKRKIKPNGSTELFTRVFPVSREPVAKTDDYLPSQRVMRLVLAHALAHQYNVCQLDINLSRIDVDLPKDYEVYIHHIAEMGGELWEGDEVVINRLIKPIHGVKHAERLWYNHIRDFLVNKWGFKELDGVTGVWVYTPNKTMKVIVMFGGEDIVICGKTTDDVKWITSKFKEAYRVEVLGVPLEFAGTRINFDFKQKTIDLDREAHIDRLAKKYKIKPNSTVITPMAEDFESQWQSVGSKQVLTGAAKQEKQAQYQRLIDDLRELAKLIRFDIASLVMRLASLADNANDFLMEAATRVLQYVVNTKTKKLTLRYRADTEKKFVGYANTKIDADDPHKATMTNFIFKHGPISWLTEQFSGAEVTETWAKAKAQTVLNEDYDYLNKVDHFLLTGQTLNS